MNTNYPLDKLYSVFRSWIFLESFKLVSFGAVYFFPKFGQAYIYYLIFLLFFVSAYSLWKTFNYFKFCFSRSIFEEYEVKRLMYASNRNLLFLIMILDIFPFLLFPQPILRIFFWKRNKKLIQYV